MRYSRGNTPLIRGETPIGVLRCRKRLAILTYRYILHCLCQ